jgi:hypothetical protein
MTSLTNPIVVLDDAPRHLGLSSVSKPFSSKWSKKGGGQLVVSSTARFLREMPTGVVHRLKDRLLLLSQIEQPTLESVERLFDAVVVAEPSADLLEILSAKNRDELFLRASHDPVANHVVIHRGDLSTLVVPLSWFTPTAGGPQPDAGRVRVVDGGQTLALGDYEAAASAILYEFDPDYRQRAKKRALARDTTFGGSLRRLRIQKGLARSDFGPNLSAKTVGRIERGEVEKPRGRTLALLAKKLKVPVDEIASY